MLKAIAFDPENIALYLDYASWLRDCGDPWCEYIELDSELNELPSDDERYASLNERWSELYSEFALKRYRGLKHLGLEPYMAGMLVPYAWMKRGVISEVEISREGILPRQAERLFRAAPAIHKLVFQGSGIKRTLLGTKFVDYHPDFASILDLPQLEQISELRFENLFLNERDVRALAESSHLTNLRKLMIDAIDPDTEPSVLKRLASSRQILKELRTLDLGRCRIDDDTLIALVNSDNLGELEELRVDGKQLTLPAIKSLASSPRLSKLKTLEYCQSTIGPEGASCIAESSVLRNLRELQLKHALIGPEGIDALSRSANCAHVKKLILHDNGLGTRGAEALARSQRWHDLEVLDLGDNDIGSDGIAALAASHCMNNVRQLNFLRSPIGNAGATALAESSQLPALMELNLYGCQIGSEGVQALAKAEWMSHVTKLQLDDNEIGPAGVEALLGSSRLSKLESLTLRRIGDLSDSMRGALTDRFGDVVSLD